MLITLFSFHFITSFLLILSSSVSVMIEKKCSSDDDCDHELICNIETKTCTCPKPYFWHDDSHTCFGCAPGWLDLETKKCLLFTVTPSPGVTWYQAETTCNALLAQPMIINNTDEFKALQDKIDTLLNGINALSTTLYFRQGAWIGINNEWSESYTWCNNNNKKKDFLDCVQIRQDNITNTICLEYVSCIKQSHFICEALPVVQSVLEKNIAESKRSVINDRNEEIIVRHRRQAQTQSSQLAQLRVIPPAPPLPNQLSGNQMAMTTKKASSFSFDSITNLINNGLTAFGHVSNAVGQVSTAVGSYYSAKQQNQQNSQSNVQEPSYMQMDPSMLQALASNGGDDSKSNLLLYGGLGGGFIIILIIIVTIFMVCSKKKSSSTGRSSTRSSESYTSVVSE